MWDVLVFLFKSEYENTFHDNECKILSQVLSVSSGTIKVNKIISYIKRSHWSFKVNNAYLFLDEKIGSNPSEETTQTEELYSSPDPEKIQSPFTQKYRACRANLQSTSWLTLSSKMVYSQELSMPEGVEIITVKPSAGLSSFFKILK